MTPGTVVSVLSYPGTQSPTRRWGTVVVAPNNDWLIVKWRDGGFDEYVHRKSVRVEDDPSAATV